MITSFTKLSCVATVLISTLLTSACSSDQITQTLEIAVDTAIAAAPAIEIAVGVSPDVQRATQVYLQAASACLTTAHSDLNAVATGTTTATAGNVSAVVAQCTAGVLANPALGLPPGTPTQIVALLSAVASAVSLFVQSLPASTTTPLVARSVRVVVPGAVQPETHGMKMNRKKLDEIKTKLAKLHAKLFIQR